MKKALYIIGGAALVVVSAAVIFLLTFDIDSYRPRIEAAASKATGLEVRIKGNMGLSLFPFGISARDIHVGSKGGEILSLGKLKMGVELMPLLKKQLKVDGCALVNPVIAIVKDEGGKYNFEGIERKSAEGGAGAAFSLSDLKVSKGTLVYIDKKAREKTELREFSLVLKDLEIPDTSADIVKNISFTGNMDCKEIRKKGLIIDNVKGPVKAGKGVFYFTSLSMNVFGGKAEGDVTADKSKVDAEYKINVKISNLDFAKLQESLGAKKVLGGKGDLYTALTMKETGSRSLMSGLNGTFSLSGDNLVIYTMDLDKVLSSYETSQEFNLVDLGAFFVAGPLSTVAIKGYRYGEVYRQTLGGRGVITKLISQWKIKSGVAEASDCALATRHNRVALKGRLNLVEERYEDVIVALLDDRGCAKFKQGISGPFGSPRIGAVSAVESLAGPLSSLYKKAKRFIQGGRCEVFYNGSLQRPSR